MRFPGPPGPRAAGRFNASNAWLACIAIAHHLTRAAAIRQHLINVAGRITRHASEITIHLPQHWPWQHNWRRLFTAVRAPPA